LISVVSELVCVRAFSIYIMSKYKGLVIIADVIS